MSHITRTSPPPVTAVSSSIPRASGRIVRTAQRAANRAALPLLRFGLAGIMIWFGAPKLLPGGSPAEALGVDTVTLLTGGIVNGEVARLALGLLEVCLGIALLIPQARVWALLALIGHMCATFTPLMLFPELTWHAPFVGSLEGQYILKNIIVVGAVLVLLSHSSRASSER